MMVEKPSLVMLNRFYWPEVAASGQMLTDLAEDLAKEGWNVTAVTSRTRYARDSKPLPRREERNGVRVIRVGASPLGSDRLAGRLVDYLSFAIGSFWRLLRIPRPEVVVAMSDPPMLLAPVLLAGRIRGFRTVYWLQDLYPHLAGKLGILSEGSLAYRALIWFVERLHSSADAVITLGPQMSRLVISASAPPDRTAHVHNWADATAVWPVAQSDNPFIREHGLNGKFVVLYSGNAGRAHTFDAVLEAMRKLRDDPEVVFLFIGGGQKFWDIRATVKEERLANVRFLNYLPREQIRYSLSAATLSLVTENPDVVGMLVPSKTYGILASGRPILFVGSYESDVAALVREHDCGVVVSPDDPDALVTAIQELRANPEVASAMGANGRTAAETTYDRRHATLRWSNTVQALLERGRFPQGAKQKQI
jgi:colanic acid biosynthesis glycosyl transferase WcaI